MQIYVHQNGAQRGPLTEAELASERAAGSVGTQDLVWWDGQPGWLPLAQTPLGAVATTPAAPPPVVPSAAALPAAPTGQRTSGMAIASMICGFSSLLIGITFIPAIVLGHMALGEIGRTPGLKGRGMAITGLIFGYAFPVLIVVSIIAISVLIALGQQVQGVFSSINSQLSAAQSS